MRQAAVIFALALVVRLAYVAYARDYQRPVRAEMELAASNLATAGELGNAFSSDSGPTAHVSPLYACFLAAFYRLFGVRYLPQSIVTTIVSSLAMALLPALATKIRLPPRVGLTAGLCLAVLPLNLWIETSGSWEQPYAALVMLGLTAVLTRLHDDGWQSRIAAGQLSVLLGIGALLSPPVFFAGTCALVAAVATEHGRRRLVCVTALETLLIAALFVVPWAYRNYLVLGAVIPFRSNVGLELAIGNNDDSDGRTFPRNATAIHPYGAGAERTRLKEDGEARYMADKGEAARRWILDHPYHFAYLCAERFRLFWMPPPDMWGDTDRLSALKSFLFTAIGVLTLIALAWFIARRQPYRFMILALLLGFSSTYVITHVNPRYRYPIFGLTSVLAVQGCFVLRDGVHVAWLRTRARMRSI